MEKIKEIRSNLASELKSELFKKVTITLSQASLLYDELMLYVELWYNFMCLLLLI